VSVSLRFIDFYIRNNVIYLHTSRAFFANILLLETVNDGPLLLTMQTDAIYIDFQKAFDSVSHSKLIAKLESYNIKGDLLCWIKAFLAHRSQQVKIVNALSDFLSISSGVPQGSVLGLTLFLLYMNDITNSLGLLSCSVKLYADNAKLYSSFCVGAHSIDLIKALDIISECINMWQLKIATNKCVAHRVSAKSHLSSNNCLYTLYDMPLQWSVATKDLGVTMDNQLVFDQHVANIVHTASSRVNLILKCFLSRDREILGKAFVTYVRPILQYCSPVWSPHRIDLINRLEDVQRRFTKKLNGLANLSYAVSNKIVAQGS